MTNELLIASSVLQWVALCAGGLVLLGIARQVGLLHERSAPLGAMITDHGPGIGDKAPTFSIIDVKGQRRQIGGVDPAGHETMLLFTSPTCPACEKLLPIVKSVARAEGINVMLVSDGAEEEHKAFLAKHKLDNLSYVISAEIGMRFQVGKVPYGVLIDEAGVIKAKGLCNTREHLESLLEASRTGHASLQDYMATKKGSPSEHSAPPLTM
ncbi:MAG: methylamine dehydrogenase accessory protein MauD [Hyphomicrobium zavarzinii]|jgi:methylamine dehydrogenase accessory protein MauD|uniref:methylamine dehydrogenase accessory protein MauD n=1 Tax=Hyphomicrobium TaxID=81 RepID=UPI00038037E9|nr:MULTISPECIES: methylamine dehydrogenase accessory protein MauD [Hyphomicrobium]MBL8846230.1 methylamine dehydrogenase accessory protein MauD [Hyphomicrobium zavarzinii]WBT38430.1 methylamine dehydrogenase accessory protein MauD [Hyphomicrobium sp. DMF-1]HML42655.1 methylamine dehydrogenase accessory protein MauD [Hyphomicrobium zavarzinii]